MKFLKFTKMAKLSCSIILGSLILEQNIYAAGESPFDQEENLEDAISPFPYVIPPLDEVAFMDQAEDLENAIAPVPYVIPPLDEVAFMDQAEDLENAIVPNVG